MAVEPPNGTPEQLSSPVTGDRGNAIASLYHVLIVLVVVLSATVLRAMHDVDTPTYSAIAVGALGYATGLTVRAKNGKA